MQGFDRQIYEMVKAQAGVAKMSGAEFEALFLDLKSRFARLTADQGAIPEGEAPAPQAMPAAQMTKEQHKERARAARASIKEKFIICLECGAKLQTLSLHLSKEHGISAKEYCMKWGLPPKTPLYSKEYWRRTQERFAATKPWEKALAAKAAKQAAAGAEPGKQATKGRKKTGNAQEAGM